MAIAVDASKELQSFRYAGCSSVSKSVSSPPMPDCLKVKEFVAATAL